jgi:cytochrome c-type biogenesis protein CcsB
MDIMLFKVTAVLYLLATASFILSLVLPKNPFSRRPSLVLLAGFVVHTSALAIHFFQTGYPAVAQFREALSFYSWLMVAVYLLVQLKYQLAVLGSFIAPLALLLSLSAFASDGGAEQLPPALRTYWLPLHVTLAFLGNAVFALAFAVSLMYLVEEYQLKNKKRSILHKSFPSLETLDRLNYIFLIWGFPLMTLGILTGSLWAGIHWGDYWSWEPREISSAITWLLYGTLLQGRVAAGWRGKKAALLTIMGFVVVLGYFLWGDSVFPSRHGGRFE